MVLEWAQSDCRIPLSEMALVSQAQVYCQGVTWKRSTLFASNSICVGPALLSPSAEASVRKCF
jgi:hypothetical protein